MTDRHSNRGADTCLATRDLTSSKVTAEPSANIDAMPKTGHNAALLPSPSTDNVDSKLSGKGHGMAFGALIIGVIVGICGFVAALVAGFGILASIGVYMGAGSLVTLVILIAAMRSKTEERSSAIPA